MDIWTTVDIGSISGGRKLHLSEFYIYATDDKFRCMLSRDISKRPQFKGHKFNLEVRDRMFRFRPSKDGALTLRDNGYIGGKALAIALSQFTDAKAFHANVVGDCIEFWAKKTQTD